VQVRLATWYLDPFGPPTPRSRRWISDLRLELDNLRFLAAGLGPTHAEMAQRLAVTVAYFHKATGAVSVGIEESIAWLHQLDTATPERVALLCRLSSAILDSGDVDGAARVADQAVVMGADVGLPGWNRVCVDFAVASIACARGDVHVAEHITRETLQRDISPDERASMLYVFALAATTWNDAVSPTVAQEQSATMALEEVVAINEERGDDWGVAMASHLLASLALNAGDRRKAARCARIVLDHALEMGDPTLLSPALNRTARLLVDSNPYAAVRLVECGQHLLEGTGFRWIPGEHGDRDKVLADAQRRLGDRRFDEARVAGALLPLMNAIGEARAVLDSVGPSVSSTHRPPVRRLDV
jgi:hypothetical protein